MPWLRLLGNRNLWLLCVTYFCSAYGWYFNITNLPDYLKDTYGINKERDPVSAGLLTGCRCFAAQLPASWAAFSPTPLFGRPATASGVGGYLAWSAKAFAACVTSRACLLRTFTFLFSPSQWLPSGTTWPWGAAWASCLDIGRKYSGIVSGCMNTVGNLGGVAATVVTGEVLRALPDNPVLGWRINFMTFTGVYLLAVFLWLMFDSTKSVVDED